MPDAHASLPLSARDARKPTVEVDPHDAPRSGDSHGSWKQVACVRVDGEPRPQPRPRATRCGDRAKVYSPSRTHAYAWQQICMHTFKRHAPRWPIDAAVRVILDFWFHRPKRLCTRRWSDWPIWHRSKPDVDNLAKLVLDAMTRTGWWVDDACVSELCVRKHYAPPGCTGCVIATVEVEDE